MLRHSTKSAQPEVDRLTYLEHYQGMICSTAHQSKEAPFPDTFRYPGIQETPKSISRSRSLFSFHFKINLRKKQPSFNI